MMLVATKSILVRASATNTGSACSVSKGKDFSVVRHPGLSGSQWSSINVTTPQTLPITPCFSKWNICSLS
jgi:hypothetical protein